MQCRGSSTHNRPPSFLIACNTWISGTFNDLSVLLDRHIRLLRMPQVCSERHFLLEIQRRRRAYSETVPLSDLLEYAPKQRDV